jgi:mono/diheme cytochrome c family protein
MRSSSIQGKDLRTHGLLRVLAALAVIFLVAIAIAPARTRFAEWRRTQARYNALALKQGVAPAEQRPHQIWKAELGVVDRCATCHVGMGKSVPVAGERLFAAHPKLPHDPADLGCTICHGGQGRATRAAEAHGAVRFWDHPMLPKKYLEASCGGCHGALALPAADEVRRGQALAARHDCLRCHQLDGAGRSADEGAPGGDLSTVGLRGLAADWHARHLKRKADAAQTPRAPLWRASYGALGPEEERAISAYLASRIGAPRLVEAKLLVHELGCRGCHTIFGSGGEEGPDLSAEGRKPVGSLDFSRVHAPAPAGAAQREQPPRSLARWLEQQIEDPARLTPGSAMPTLPLTPAERERVTLYLLSLRDPKLPANLWTRERVRVEKLKERDFATDGRSLFGTFCAGCHGRAGEGHHFPAQKVVFPAIASPEHLGLASDAQLRRAIVEGRAGSKMLAWGTREGGLREEEVGRLVGYLRSLEPAAPPLERVAAEKPDLALGARLYARDCSSCHGARGQGSSLGSPLAAADSVRELAALHRGTVDGKPGTPMGRYRAYTAAELASLLGHVAALPVAEGAARASWKLGRGDPARGRERFARTCSGCHGAKGVGGEAPRIGAAAFLTQADDAYIAGTAVRGHPGTAMPGFGMASLGFPLLDPDEVLDVTAYLRSLAPRSERRKP